MFKIFQTQNNPLRQQFTQPQNLATHIQSDYTEQQPPQRHSSDSGNPTNRHAEAIVGLACQQKSLTVVSFIQANNNKHTDLRTQNKKIELLEDLFRTKLKMQTEMTEMLEKNHFHSNLRIEELQTFRNINASNKRTLEDVLIKHRGKYVRPQSPATAKHKWHKVILGTDSKS